MNVPNIASQNIEDRGMRDDGNPLSAKLAKQRKRGRDAGLFPEPNVLSQKMDNDIEATISDGQKGEFGWLDALMKQLAAVDRRA